MDPSNKPDSESDASGANVPLEDSGSLDTANASSEESLDSADAAGSTGAISNGGLPPKKESFIKRLWRRFNIYLLLFILILAIAGALTVVLVLRSKNANPDNSQITSQGLSESTLQQLANSDTTVGSPKQILNVASNAIFSGSVLLRSNLEVAGTVKLGGALTLPGITVSGNSTLGEVQASTLAISGPTTVQGVFTAKNGMNVTGKSTFNGELSAAQLTTGTLQLNGDLKLTHHVTAGGPIPEISRGTALGGGGTVSVSGSDTAGSVNISTGNAPPAGCFATITFSSAFSSTPHIVITPVGSAAGNLDYYVTRSTSNFSICTTNAPASGAQFGFDYLSLD